MHEISLKPEIIFDLGILKLTNTLLTSLVVVLFLMIVFVLIIENLKTYNPSKVQIAFEYVYNGMGNIYRDITGHKYSSSWLFSLVFSIFIYILISNWFGLLPFVGTIGINKIIHTDHGEEHKFLSLFRAPTSDLSITLGFAILSVLLANILGFRKMGLRYGKKYFDLSSPVNFIVGILEFISEIGKIISFSFRLFGNIFAGEVLLVVITYISWGLATLPFFGLEIFVGFIQAFVFYMLTIVFINLATSSH